MSLSDSGRATTDIASFFRAPDLNACSWATMYGSVWPAIFGASGAFESPSRPWQAWHISAFARPAFKSPASLRLVARRETGANKHSASRAVLRPVRITCLSLQMSGGGKPDGPRRRGPSRSVRNSLAVVPDAIERPDEIVRDQQRTVGQLRHIDRPTQVIAIVVPPLGKRLGLSCGVAVVLEERHHHTRADRHGSIP